MDRNDKVFYVLIKSLPYLYILLLHSKPLVITYVISSKVWVSYLGPIYERTKI